jgi:hypothetical protein
MLWRPCSFQEAERRVGSSLYQVLLQSFRWWRTVQALRCVTRQGRCCGRCLPVWLRSASCVLPLAEESWCELFGLSSPHGSSLPTALLCSCATCSTRRRGSAGSLWCLHTRRSLRAFEVRSGFHGRTCPEFYRHSSFWDFIECCFHNMLV